MYQLNGGERLICLTPVNLLSRFNFNSAASQISFTEITFKEIALLNLQNII